MQIQVYLKYRNHPIVSFSFKIHDIMNSQRFLAFKSLIQLITKPKTTNLNTSKTVTTIEQDIDWEAVPSH